MKKKSTLVLFISFWPELNAIIMSNCKEDWEIMFPLNYNTVQLILDVALLKEKIQGNK